MGSKEAQRACQQGPHLSVDSQSRHYARASRSSLLGRPDCPSGTLPELLQPSTAPAEPQNSASQPNSELLLQLETERNLAQAYGSRVEKLSARIASLQSDHNTELQHRLGRHQEELLRREKQLRDLEAKAASDSKAERARLEQAEKASAKALAEAQAQQAQMRETLERLQKKLTRAQEVTVPPVHL